MSGAAESSPSRLRVPPAVRFGNFTVPTAGALCFDRRVPRSLALVALAAWLLSALATRALAGDGSAPGTVGVLLASPGASDPDLDAIARRLDALAAKTEAVAAGDAIERARTELRTARELRASGAVEAAARKVRLARAALALAECRIARAQAEHELAAARRRVATAEADALRAREARAAAERRLTELRGGAP